MTKKTYYGILNKRTKFMHSRFYPTKEQAIAEAFSKGLVMSGPSIPDFPGDDVAGKYLVPPFRIVELKD